MGYISSDENTRRESRQRLNDDVLWLIVIFCTTDNGITKMPLQKMNSEVRPEDGKRRHVICVDRQNIPITLWQREGLRLSLASLCFKASKILNE